MVTTPNGRGVWILDFLCLSQTQEIVCAVLRHLKTANALWPKTEAFIIDKDFVESSAIARELSHSKVGCCLHLVHPMLLIRGRLT